MSVKFLVTLWTGNNDNDVADGSLSDMNLKARDCETLGSCNANFFDANNKNALQIRGEVVERALIDILKWINIQNHSLDESVEETITKVHFSKRTDGNLQCNQINSSAKRIFLHIIDKSSSPRKNWSRPCGFDM